MPKSRAHDSDPNLAEMICGHARHDLIKKDFTTFQAYTTRLAEMPEDDLLLGNCKACGSTITIPLAWERKHYESLRAQAQL